MRVSERLPPNSCLIVPWLVKDQVAKTGKSLVRETLPSEVVPSPSPSPMISPLRHWITICNRRSKPGKIQKIRVPAKQKLKSRNPNPKRNWIQSGNRSLKRRTNLTAVLMARRIQIQKLCPSSRGHTGREAGERKHRSDSRTGFQTGRSGR